MRGFTLLVGTILIVDVGLLGIGMRRQPVSRIAEGLSPWTLGRSRIGPMRSRLAGGLSLTLWITTAFAAKWIEFA